MPVRRGLRGAVMADQPTTAGKYSGNSNDDEGSNSVEEVNPKL